MDYWSRMAAGPRSVVNFARKLGCDFKWRQQAPPARELTLTLCVLEPSTATIDFPEAGKRDLGIGDAFPCNDIRNGRDAADTEPVARHTMAMAASTTVRRKQWRIIGVSLNSYRTTRNGFTES